MDTVLKYMENNTAYLDQEYIYEPWHIYIPTELSYRNIPLPLQMRSGAIAS